MGGIPGLLPDIPEHGQVLSCDGIISQYSTFELNPAQLTMA